MSCCFIVAAMTAIQSQVVGLSSITILGPHRFLASSNVALNLVDLLTELLLSFGLFIELFSHTVELGPGVRLGGLRTLGFLISLRCHLKSCCAPLHRFLLAILN